MYLLKLMAGSCALTWRKIHKILFRENKGKLYIDNFYFVKLWNSILVNYILKKSLISWNICLYKNRYGDNVAKKQKNNLDASTNYVIEKPYIFYF